MYFWRFVIIIIIVLLGINAYLVNEQNDLIRGELPTIEEEESSGGEIDEGVRLLLANTIHEVKDELEGNPNRSLSDETISRIADLSTRLLPESDQYFEVDTLVQERRSEGRGQLLIHLSRMKMDSSSFQDILHKVSFARADLFKADLSGLDLSGIVLTSAYLKEAKLDEVNFLKADLRGANLWGVQSNNTNYREAQIQGVDMRWAEAMRCDFTSIKATGGDFKQSKLKGCVFKNVKATVAHFDGCMLNESQFINADLKRSSMVRANLTKTAFIESDMRRLNLSEARLIQAVFSESLMDKVGLHTTDWIRNLRGWKVEGEKEIREKYTVDDPFESTTNYALRSKQ